MSDPTYEFYWEDFTTGFVREFGPVTVEAAAIVDFARQFDPQPFHLSEEAGRASLFGGLAASGWHTASLTMRLMCDGIINKSASLGSPGLEGLKWLKPVLAGDQLRARMIVLGSRPMNSKPHVGLVHTRWETLNQRDELVMTIESWAMFRRRTPGTPPAA
ncbi:MAG: MaoC family dehydratase [Aquabacterium sp.]|nr:MAG: MaoC family dehydratase [Aquabacterium sp.]